MQIPGVNYTEAFSPAASDTAIRLEMLDVEASFL
jgi:hypothetical protein